MHHRFTNKESSIFPYQQLVWSLIGLALLTLFTIGVAVGQTRGPSTKIIKSIYAPGGNQLSLDAEISFPTGPNGGMVRIKYIYNNEVPIHDKFATWKIRFINTRDQLVIKQVSVPIGGSELISVIGNHPINAKSASEAPFPCLQVIDPCYDITLVSKAVVSEFISPAGLAPDSIGGAVALRTGQPATLQVLGGALGVSGRWVWYEGQCGGTPVGTGRSLTITPNGNTTYFVRAEPGTMACATTTVRVDNRSVAPKQIGGPATACAGEPLTLQVVGGALGVEADWVWYAGSCGSSQRLGTGRTLTVPVTDISTAGGSRTYVVRAEGKYNTTACATRTVTLLGHSQAPAGIKAEGPTQFCEGSSTPLTLRVAGGQLAKGSIWTWHADSENGPTIGTGESLSITPTVTTAYFVRAEGGCPPTAAARLMVQVLRKSQTASTITVPSSVPRAQPFTLRVSGGQLGEGATWQWFAKDCRTGSLLGTGESLTLKLRRPTQVFVRAVGPCGQTDCASTSVQTGTARRWEHAYQPQKFLHFGLGLGLDFQHAVMRSGRRVMPVQGPAYTDTVRSSASAVGLLGEVVFHPLLKNGLSLGLRSTAAIGTGWYGLLDANDTESHKRFSYYEFRVGSELAVGHRRLKLLLTQEQRFREYRFENSSDSWSINQRDRSYFTRLGAGIRLGAYNRPLHTANTVDAQVYLVRTNKAFSTTDMYASMAQWNVGAGLNWWCQNKLGVRLETVLRNQQRDYQLLNTSFDGAQFSASLILREDFFR